MNGFDTNRFLVILASQ